MNKRQLLLKIIWWIYISLLFLIVILKFRGSITELNNKISSTPFGTNCNLVPFRSISVQLKYFSEGWARFNLFGNLIPFVPIGCLLPITFKNTNSLLKVSGIGLSFILFSELFQFITRLGSFDVDDIILNLLGVFIGFLLFKFAASARKSSQ